MKPSDAAAGSGLNFYSLNMCAVFIVVDVVMHLHNFMQGYFFFFSSLSVKCESFTCFEEKFLLLRLIVSLFLASLSLFLSLIRFTAAA